MSVNDMFRRSRAIVAGFVVMAMISGLSARAQSAGEPSPGFVETPLVASGRLKGRVLEADGDTPVADAVVRAHHLDSGTIYASSPTDKKGRYEIPDLPFGYFDVSVETADGHFAGSQVVGVSPGDSVGLPLVLSRFGDDPAAWWSGPRPTEVPGVGAPAVGRAEVDRRTADRSFWRSPAGIAIVAAGGVAALLAVASSGSDERSSSPSTP